MIEDPSHDPAPTVTPAAANGRAQADDPRALPGLVLPESEEPIVDATAEADAALALASLDGTDAALGIDPLDVDDEGDAGLALDALEVAELAGVTPDELEVEISGDTLRVAGTRRDETLTELVSYHQLEITYSRFEKTIRFPCPVDGARVERRYKDGLLVLHLRSPEECD